MESRTPSRRPGSMATSPPGRAFDGVSNGMANMTVGSDFGGSGAAGDLTNPFIAKSKPSSPTKSIHDRPASRQSNIDSHTGTSGIRSGMGMDVVGGDWKSVANAGAGVMTGMSSKSSKGLSGKGLDRFIPSRQNSTTGDYPIPSLSAASSQGDTSLASSEHSANYSLLSSSSAGAPHTRILSFHSAPPPSTATSHLDIARKTIRSAVPSTPGASSTSASTSTSAATKRRTPTIPERVLDAPGFANDYYLNLLSWSCTNKVGIGLAKVAYVWDADSGDVQALHDSENEDQADISSLAWAGDGAYLAIGNDYGEVEIWDVEQSKKIRTMAGHRARVGTLAWNGPTLSSGCRDGSIYHHDVRVAKHKVQELNGHRSEVCGLAWRSDGQFLASGGNDNVVNCWDGRIGQSVITDESGVAMSTPKWQKMNHTAAVKAIAWCPWQSSLLATGGGTNDQTIHFWSSTTGARLSSLPTPSQVTSLVWSPHSKEILSTHGFPDNQIALWSYPALQKIYEFPAHDERVLCSALSPDGCTVVTGACDENLKFWKIWEAKTGYKAKIAADPDRSTSRSKISTKLR